MKRIAVIISLVVCVFSLVACAGNGGHSPSTTLKVDMSEFMFTPNDYVIPAGQEITLELKNSGSIKHDFIILKKGVVVQTSFDREKQKDDIYFQALLESNNVQTFTFTAPAEAGEYQIICGIPGHFQAGMTAKLIVVAP